VEPHQKVVGLDVPVDKVLEVDVPVKGLISDFWGVLIGKMGFLRCFDRKNVILVGKWGFGSENGCF
jgi:hypothetical protein